MNKTLIACIVAAMTMLAVPATVGADGYRSWMYDGAEEPNVPGWDDDGTVMQQDANAAANDKIYFDAVWDRENGQVTNVRTEDTNVRNYGISGFRAYLGYWRDCNNDGFVGSVVTGAFQYPIEQGQQEASMNGVNADDICPPGTPYQDDLQYYEFLSIGPNARDISGDDTLCPTTAEGPGSDDSRDPYANRAPQDGQGILDGGDNIACGGERENYIQDDFAKVWHDWGIPTDQPTATTLLFPLPDGFSKDTNGHLRYVDSLTFGFISGTTGLWPAPTGNGDPAPANQCENGEGDLADVEGNVNGAIEGVTTQECSPVPNYRYITTPAGEVAYPGHIAEDRVNNSESNNDPGTPITAPFDDASGENGDTEPNNDRDSYEASEDCELKSDPDTWDDNPGDGDPLYGWDATNPSDFSAYYGTNEDGPSLSPTYGNVASKLGYEIEKADDEAGTGLYGDPACNRSGLFGGWEFHGGGATNTADDKKAVDTGFGYFQDFTYNPGTAPGGPAPDATMCTHLQGSIEDTPTRCSARWQSGSQWFHSHGTTGLSPAPFAANIGTFYADVSFGNLGGFDTAGDGLFSEDKYQHGFFEAPAGLALESALPAGVDDAHVYGDENCGSIDPLDTAAGGTDASYSEGTISPIGTNWSCDREAWATDAGADFDCEDAVDERDCYMLPKVGDGYDFRDVECQDNDVLGESTTDSEGILAGTGQEGRSCQSLTPAPS